VYPDRRVVAFTSRHGLTTSGAALALVERLALPIVTVALDASDDPSAFARGFSRACAGGGPALVAGASG
jgi:hypothetical protein